jgi:replicative DNA helicase
MTAVTTGLPVRKIGAQMKPSFDDAAESAIISTCLANPSLVDDLADRLVPAHFYSTAYRDLYAAILELRGMGTPVDTVTVSSHVSLSTGQLPTIPEVDPVDAETLTAYAAIVVDHWVKRKLVAVSGRILTGQSMPSAELLEAVAKDVSDLALSRHAEAMVPLVVPLRAALKAADEAARRGGGLSGLSYGLKELDRMTGGLRGGEVAIIAARPGGGKTALVGNNICAGLAATGHAVAFFSLEMPARQVAQRIACSRARVNYRKIIDGAFSMDEWQRMQAQEREIAAWRGFYIDDTPAITLETLRSKCRKVVRELASSRGKLGLIAVDYVQLMRGTGEKRVEELGAISRGIKTMAKELDVPVVILAQLNREVEKRQERGKPLLSDLRECGDLEQDSDIVMFLHREELYDRNTKLKGIAELIVAKQRNGPVGSRYVSFSKEWMTFGDLSDQERVKAGLEAPQLS